MYNFVLFGKEKLPGNNRANQFFTDAGEEPYSEWEEEFEIVDGQNERLRFVVLYMIVDFRLQILDFY